MYVAREAPVQIAKVGAVVQEQAAVREGRPTGDRRQLGIQREAGNPLPVDEHGVIRKHDYGVTALLPHLGEGLVDLGHLANGKVGDGNTQLLCRLLGGRTLAVLAGMLRPSEQSDPAYVGQRVLEEL